MDQIRNYFEQLVGINDSDWLAFSSKLVKSEHPKKSCLLKVRETENYFSFIEKGSVRLYFPKEENGLTFGFCFEGQFVSAYDSFLTQKPCD